jgi:Tol biopolymer transport system component
MRLLAAALAAAAVGSTATAPRQIAFVAVGTGATDVLVIGADGRGAHVVAAHATGPRWSADGTRLVYTGLRTDAHGSASTVGLFVAAAAGGTPAQLTTGSDSAFGWSPNGRWIGFIRAENGTYNVYVVRTDGSGLRPVARVLGSAEWAPDSMHILVAVRRGLALVDLAGRIRMLPHTACSGDGSLSPDGRWLAFARCLGLPSHTGIAVERLDGSGLRWLARPVTDRGGNGSPAWSPDGTKIAYVEERPVGYLEHTEIRMVSLAGKNLGNLDSYAQDHDEYPEWSPDGTQIVFDRDAAIEPIGESDRLYVGDVKTGRVRELYEYIARGNQFWRPR